MKEKLIITDVTRMSGGAVCVGGIATSDGTCRRPIFSSSSISIPESWLYNSQNDDCIVFPFAEVELDFQEHKPVAPHTEDWIVDRNFRRYCGKLQDRKKFLEEIAFPYVSSIFEAVIVHNKGYYVKEGRGVRSLGTVRANISNCFYGPNYGKWDFRIEFVDQKNREFRLKVTDLSFQYYCRYLYEEKDMPTQEISSMLTEQLSNSVVFLRLGLTRPTWEKYPHRCFLQITGVYSFPDYLDGRCFADFYRPSR